MKTLDLGCGKTHHYPGAVTLDASPLANPDIVHDLNTRPYPFESNTFDRIIMGDIIEHVREIIPTMEEVHRIGKSGAIVKITTPHFSCSNSFVDPTHIHHLSFFTFDLFTETEKNFFTSVRFEKVSSSLVFYPKYKNWAISRFANRYPRFYEEHLCWLLPAWFMIFELRIIK